MEQANLKSTKKMKKVNEDSSGLKKKSSILHTLVLILIIIFLTSILVFGSIIVFNIAGLKSDVAKLFVNVPLVGTVVKPIAENKSPLDMEKEQIALEKKDLSVQLQKLNEKEKELEAKNKALEDKELELKAKEESMNSTMALLDSKLRSVTEQVEYIEKMDTSKAAQILLNMTERSSVIQILRNMKKDKAVAIISFMDPLQAAQLIEELSKAEGQNGSTSKTGVDENTLP